MLSSSAPAVFNRDLLETFFASQSLTNATSLPLNSSISCFVTVSDFGVRKKIIWNLTLPVQVSPPHAGKGQIPHSLGTEDSQLPGVCTGGWGDVEVSIFLHLNIIYFTNQRKKWGIFYFSVGIEGLYVAWCVSWDWRRGMKTTADMVMVGKWPHPTHYVQIAKWQVYNQNTSQILIGNKVKLPVTYLHYGLGLHSKSLVQKGVLWPAN